MNDDTLLGIYLNDHLAGAASGAGLAKRLAGTDERLQWLADEIDEDRAALRGMMAAIGVPVRQYKTWAASALEKVSRLKPNGRLLGRSPLSRVVELEAMRLGVEGKAAGWRTLRTRAEHDARLDSSRLDLLIERAQRQIDELERLRVGAAAEAFGGDADVTNRGDAAPTS
jgi:hypothetical protein